MSKGKYVKLIKELGANTIAFGLGIVIQQLLVMPVLAKCVSDEIFSEIIIFHSVFNFLCVVVGEELGNVRMIRNNIYASRNLHGDFNFLLFILVGILVVFTNIGWIFVDISYVELILYLVVAILGIIRYYGMTGYRLEQQFNTILLISSFYCIGEVVGLAIAVTTHFYIGVFLLGELFALGCWMVVRWRNKDRLSIQSFSKTPEMCNTVKMYGEIGGVAVISNGVAYLDRLLVYPLAGATAMNMYYGASSMSKMLSLIINPFSTFILAKLVGIKEDYEEKIVKKCIRIMFPLLIVFVFGSIIVTYFGVSLFYSQYLETATELLIPIGLATALGLETALVKPLVMRFFEAKKLLFVQIFYAVVLIACMYGFSYKWGMYGFAWATCLARAFQLIAYFLLLKIRKRGTTK